MLSVGVASVACERNCAPRSWGGFGESAPQQTSTSVRLSVQFFRADEPCANPHDQGDMPKYLPAGLTQYVLNNFFSQKSPPYHVTQDDVSTPLQRPEVEKITGHQSVGGRGGVIAVMYETHWAGLSGPSWEREWTCRFFATRYCVTGRALPTSTAKPTACTPGCELVLHN